jgi:hypothetical protein
MYVKLAASKKPHVNATSDILARGSSDIRFDAFTTPVSFVLLAKLRSLAYS